MKNHVLTFQIDAYDLFLGECVRVRVRSEYFYDDLDDVSDKILRNVLDDTLDDDLSTTMMMMMMNYR